VNDPVRALAALADEELELIASNRIEALPELHGRRAAALAALPAQFTAAEREALTHVHELQEQATALLQLAANETAAHLGRIERGTTALRGYAAALKAF
jgi:hypothetical protein